MDFKKYLNGAGVILLAVCFCVSIHSSAAAGMFVPKEMQQKIRMNDELYASLLAAYKKEQWHSVLERFAQYKAVAVQPDQKTESMISFTVDMEEKNRKKKELTKYNAMCNRMRKEYVTAHGVAAIAYAYKEQFVAAHNTLRAVQEYGDEQAIIPAARGVVAYMLKDYNAAEPFLKTAHALDSTLLAPVYHLYKIALKRGNKGSAFFWLEKAAALEPERLDLIMGQARLLQRLGQSSAAELMYSLLLSKDSNNAIAYNNRGYCRIALGKLDAAFDDFSKALSINDMYTEALLNRAALWRTTKNLPAALNDLNTGIQISPGDTRLLVSRMQTLRDMGRFMLAKQDMEKLLVLSNAISVVNEAGWFLATCPSETVRNGKRAVTLLLEIVERSKRHPRVLDSLAAAYAASAEFDKAVTTQQEALVRGTEYRLPNYQLTRYEERLALYVDNRPFRTRME